METNASFSSRLKRLGDFFAGDKSFRTDEYDEPIDLVTAHAVYNYLSATQLSTFSARNREDVAKSMSSAELQEALKLARVCAESDFATCLNAIDERYRGSDG